MIPVELNSVSKQYEAFIADAMRDNRSRKLAKRARTGQPRWFSRQLAWILCELDYRRIVLARRLERYQLAQSILRAHESKILSSSQCN